VRGDIQVSQLALEPVRRLVAGDSLTQSAAALPSLTLSLGLHRAPDSWRDYLFWDISWDRA